MKGYKHQHLIITVLFCLLFSSNAWAGNVIGDFFKRVYEALHGDILENIAMISIMLVLILTMFTRVLDWKGAGIILSCIAAAFGVVEIYGFATGK